MNDVMRLIKTGEMKVVKQEFDNVCKMTIQVNADDAPEIAKKIAEIDGTSVIS
jgi:uncharacterized protein YqgV (UPF0045/DUF77 family)